MGKNFRESNESRLLLVNLGCGNRFHKAWRNFDFNSTNALVHAHDLRTGIPLEDASVDALYSSHCLEHFSPDAAASFLRECYRVLKPGAVFRIVVPDLEQIARAYVRSIDDCDAGDPDAPDRHQWMLIELLDQLCRHESGGEMAKHWADPLMPAEDFVTERVGSEFLQAREHLLQYGHFAQNKHQGHTPDPHEVGAFRTGGEPHLWMYDRISLRKLLVTHGFSDITLCNARTSGIPQWTDYELDANKEGLSHKPDSLYMECKKLG